MVLRSERILPGSWNCSPGRLSQVPRPSGRMIRSCADGRNVGPGPLRRRTQHDAGCGSRIGATPEGKKELIGFQTGMRESAQSWKELLVDLKVRGLSIAPEVAVGDGALGFWKALDEMFPATRHQRCWLHKIAEKYAPKYDKAVECLIKDRETLLTFFDFPADHWDHLRTTNPVESVFATVRHRTVRMKGALSQDTARLMVFKLVMAASKTWRRLHGQNQLPKVIQGVKFQDGIEVAPEAKSAA